MRKILLDTSFLITLLSEERENHNVALQYYKYCLDNNYPLFLSTICISEYCLKGRIEELPLDDLIVLPFNADDAIKSADLNFKNYIENDSTRIVVKDDFKLIGQAEVRNCDLLLTGDKNTLFRYVKKLKSAGKIKLDAITLEFFKPSLISGNTSDDQLEML